MDTNGARHRNSTASTNQTGTPPVTISGATPGTGRTADESTGDHSAALVSGRRNGPADGLTSALMGGPSRSTPRFAPDAFADERDDVLGVINELEDQLDRYEEIRSNLERELAETHSELAAARQRLHEAEWQAGAAQTRIAALEQVRDDIALLEEEVADANARTQRVTEQLGRAQSEVSRLTQELKAANKQIDELTLIRRERDGLRSEMRTLQGRIDQAERATHEWIGERTGLQGRIDDLRVALEEQRTGRVHVDAELRGVQEQLAESLRTRQALVDKLEAVRGEKKSLQVQLTHFERENARLVEQQKTTETEAATLRTINRGAETALTNVKRAFTEVQAALAETRMRARRRPVDLRPRESANATAEGSEHCLLSEVNEAIRGQTERSATSGMTMKYPDLNDSSY